MQAIEEVFLTIVNIIVSIRH